jgi:2-polyprenyl-6-methoxyphenol hydroxylase-like FAD-dependent oxidoreductase
VLQRAGIAAGIVEIDKDWRVYGAGITITGPALRALDRLGLLDAVVREGYCYDATRICDAAGNVILASRVSGRPLGAHSERRRNSAAGAASDSGGGDASVGCERAARTERYSN